MATEVEDTIVHEFAGRRVPRHRLLRTMIDLQASLDEQDVQQQLLQELIASYVALEARIEGLLRNTLPPVVAEEIKLLGHYAPRPCECSILFADLVGFTQLAEAIPNEVLIGLLNRIFSRYDEIVEQHGGTKIKTIGDCYMVTFGTPEPCADHAAAAIATGLAMLTAVRELSETAPRPIAVRIGLHSGLAYAAVVGRTRLQFDVFGDQVNIASRFESAGQPGRLHVSAATRELAGARFRYEERGLVPLKGKAAMPAYFVLP
jgi:class 3 adenylate cyclase